jgi:hypothetical protein
MNLRVQREKRAAVEKEQRQTQKKENALKSPLPSITENHHHPEKLQQRPRRIPNQPDVEQCPHEAPTGRILSLSHMQYNHQVPYFSCTT